MTEAGRWIVLYLVNSLWQTPLLMMAAWLVSRMLRKLGCVAQHRVWIGALTVAAIAPFAALDGSTVSIRMFMTGGPAGVLLEPHNSAAAARLASGTVRLDPALYVTIIVSYLTFLALAALRLGLGLYKTQKLVRSSTAVGLPPESAKVWQRCKIAFAIPSTRLASSTEIAGPVAIGVRNSVLLMPPGFLSESTPDDLAAALGHECAHLERRDFFWNLLYQVVSLPIAYHPATWMIKSRIAETRELICDRIAAERIAGSGPYASSLLRLAAAMHAGATTNSHAIGMFDANTLENRIMSLTTAQPSVSRGRKVILAASGILLLSLSGIAAVALGADVEEQANAGPQQAAVDPARQSSGTPIDSSSQNPPGQPPHIYHVGGDVSAPKLVYAPDPEYPKGEKRQGKVVIQCIVDENGSPQQVHVVHPFAPQFDESAVRAVELYRFTPAMRQGNPVAVEVNIEVNFRRN